MKLDDNDLLLIRAAVARGGKIWDDDSLAPVKKKIKEHYKKKVGGCCYCRKPFVNEFNMVIDIEHVLPKSSFSEFMFELFNLNISCKRCNMRIKQERTDFLVDPQTIRANAQRSDQYRLIHPNLDEYTPNMGLLEVGVDGKRFVKYNAKTDKGKYTYSFFELDKLEVETLNELQGIDSAQTELSAAMAPAIIQEALALLRRLQEN